MKRCFGYSLSGWCTSPPGLIIHWQEWAEVICACTFDIWMVLSCYMPSMQSSSVPCRGRCWSWMALGPGFLSRNSLPCAMVSDVSSWYMLPGNLPPCQMIQAKWTLRHLGAYWWVLACPESGTAPRAIHGLLSLREAALCCTEQAVLLRDPEASEGLEKWSNYRSLYHDKWQGVSARMPKKREWRLGRLLPNQEPAGYVRERMDVRAGQPERPRINSWLCHLTSCTSLGRLFIFGSIPSSSLKWAWVHRAGLFWVCDKMYRVQHRVWLGVVPCFSWLHKGSSCPWEPIRIKDSEVEDASQITHSRHITFGCTTWAPNKWVMCPKLAASYRLNQD